MVRFWNAISNNYRLHRFHKIKFKIASLN
jgi:hypothetical protein